MKPYRGMASLEALREGVGSRSRYYQEGAKADDLVIQGRKIWVPYKGPVEKELKRLTLALKYSMARHCGVPNIKELRTSEDLEFVVRIPNKRNRRR